MTENKPAISVDDLDKAPSTLPTSTTPVNLPSRDIERLQDAFNRVSSENFTLQEEIIKLKRSNAAGEILNSLVKPYANRAFVFMCIYCGVVAATLVFSGWKVGGFELPAGVLEVLTGSTAVTVIGLVGMVLTGIFVGARK